MSGLVNKEKCRNTSQAKCRLPEDRHGVSVILKLVAAFILAVFAMHSVANSTDDKLLRTGWYLSGGIGVAWGPDMKQDGWNRDTFCYPDAACFNQDPIPNVSGFNWFYDIGLDRGTAFEFSMGRFVGRTRIELAFSQQASETSQSFTGITYLDGSVIRTRPNGTVNSNGQGSIDHRRVRSVTLDAYFDFPDIWNSITPYIGAGIGQASVEMVGVRYSTEYQDLPSAVEVYDPPLSFYDSIQDADLKDNAITWRVHAGADYVMNRVTSLGLRLTWSATEDIEVSGSYETHPMHEAEPSFMNLNAFSDVSSWSLMLSFRRVIDL